MPLCGKCSSELPTASKFCPLCGAAVEADLGVTQTFSEGLGFDAPERAAASTQIRFLPGTTIAQRYRVVGLLGSGGMGEVYHAQDLKLGTPVALKFLPRQIARDPSRLQYFLEEARLARQITHPNVCRVFDVGEVDGEHFLSMEYVDGEDLAGLLTRIGRLPEEKGIQIARQLCSGIAAAHERGVIHRDLKPANIMLDGRGQVRIADFGLARQSQAVVGDDARSGTPAYMAPEQLEGKQATVRSDVYALGLVLYEIFTGKKVFQADSLADLIRVRERTLPVPPSSHGADLDPPLERLILLCLEKDPQQRPASVAEVMAALPGGDPLAAARAAGETPSPETIAESGAEGTIGPLFAAALAGVIVLAVLGRVLLSGNTLYRRIPIDLSPQQLSYEARRVVTKLGYTEPPTDSSYRLFSDRSFLRYIKEHAHPVAGTNPLVAGRPTVLYFWYVQSPRLLLPFSPGAVGFENPPQTLPGMAQVWLDVKGRLTQFRCVPDRAEPTEDSEVRDPDWAEMFAVADLDMGQFEPTEPLWNPPFYSDSRAAWMGEYPEWPGMPLRVEAAAYRGRAVYFSLVPPWAQPPRRTGGVVHLSLRNYLALLLPLLALLGGAWLARRNWRRGRVDQRGAIRISGFVFCLHMWQWAAEAHHVPLFHVELSLFLGGLGKAVYWSVIVWVSYLAVEPHWRHRWPQRIVSWTRLLGGRFRDPLVGKHLLLGTAVGATSACLMTIHREIPGWLGQPPRLGSLPPGLTNLLATLPQTLLTAIDDTLILAVLFLATMIVFRQEWLATAVLMAVSLIYFGGRAASHPVLEASFVTLVVALYLLVYHFYGLLPASVAMFCHWFLLSVPLTFDFGTWYAGNVVASMLCIAALATYGLITATEEAPAT